ncbi:hypothetical protein ACRRTK_021232 [Alexandromys fortis]
MAADADSEGLPWTPGRAMFSSSAKIVKTNGEKLDKFQSGISQALARAGDELESQGAVAGAQHHRGQGN